MFSSAFLEEAGSGKLRHEECLLQGDLERRGIPVTLYTLKRVQRRQLPLSSTTFIAGGMEAMHGAMQQLSIEVPRPNDYPKSLRAFLHRQVWSSTLGEIESEVLEGNGKPVFAKPAERCKNFTGRLFASVEDFRWIGSISRSQKVWCSEVVSWASEYRVYVIGTQIAGVDLYAGDPWEELDRVVVQTALEEYRASGEAPSAYGIDFGVLTTGQTALIEANDGFSLGAYQVPAAAYTDLLLTRWQELLSTIAAKQKITE